MPQPCQGDEQGRTRLRVFGYASRKSLNLEGVNLAIAIARNDGFSYSTLLILGDADYTKR
ncbi:hypothetical protein [Roseofilum capinflatum]|uniref:Uncharacterized protein n=1 Tax=Roseofilum capinflatum BLCC-M114 TaxID=3022440 RepID=A0ABT7BBX8_9CYAN|nr:hypothetical protein [Roseofilum capinflatum]MDJ1176697.1 hypothetical protein [Roseofilum capinflatum BLCC-M114]